MLYAVWLFRSGAGAFVSPRPVAFIILFTQGYTFRVNNRLYRTTNTPYMSVNDDGTSENAAATEADINTVYCIVVSSVFGCRRTESNHHSKVFAPMVSDLTAAAWEGVRALAIIFFSIAENKTPMCEFTVKHQSDTWLGLTHLREPDPNMAWIGFFAVDHHQRAPFSMVMSGLVGVVGSSWCLYKSCAVCWSCYIHLNYWQSILTRKGDTNHATGDIICANLTDQHHIYEHHAFI